MNAAPPFTTLINQVITILTSYVHDIGKAYEAATPELGRDAHQQGKEMYEAVQARFSQETDGKASRALELFITEDPEEFSYNLRQKLTSLLPANAYFANELRQIASRPLFIGREQELQEYASFLSKDFPWIWIFTALERSGKTHLLKQMGKKTPTNIPVIRLDFAREQSRYNQSTRRREPIDAREYLRTFADQVKTECDPQNYAYFEEELNKTYDASKYNILNIIEQSLNVGESSIASQNRVNIATSMDTLMQQQRKDARTSVTPAFLKLMESFKPNHLVIQLDTCEWLMEPINMEIRQWLVEELLLKLHEIMHQKQFHVVMMSSVAITLPLVDSEDQKQSLLEPLDRESVQQYLQRIGVSEPELYEQFYDMTNGHAFCVWLLCKLWQQWEKEGKSLSNTEMLIEFQKDFYQQADKEFISKHVLAKFSIPNLDKFERLPLYQLTRYGIILREFNLPLLMAVFRDLLTEPGAKGVFDQLTDRLYIIRQRDKQNTYAMLELFRTVLGQSIRVEEPKIWRRYHEYAKDFFAGKIRPIERPRSSDWHYHNLACYLVDDDNEESVNRYWTETLKDLEILGVIPPKPLIDAACDKTLMFTSVAVKAQKYKPETSKEG